MSKPEVVYVIYIRATPQRVWQGLTDPAFTERYWYGTRIVSDWKEGSSITFHTAEGNSDSGKVLTSDPPRRLSFSWRRGSQQGVRNSRVTFTIETTEDAVKLTLVNDNFDEGSRLPEGWPKVLSGLKTLIETGTPLNI
jgi:uncharacterized protein YndB with AHSA1/START domain